MYARRYVCQVSQVIHPSNSLFLFFFLVSLFFPCLFFLTGAGIIMCLVRTSIKHAEGLHNWPYWRWWNEIPQPQWLAEERSNSKYAADWAVKLSMIIMRGKQQWSWNSRTAPPQAGDKRHVWWRSSWGGWEPALSIPSVCRNEVGIFDRTPEHTAWSANMMGWSTTQNPCLKTGFLFLLVFGPSPLTIAWGDMPGNKWTVGPTDIVNIWKDYI